MQVTTLIGTLSSHPVPTPVSFLRLEAHAQHSDCAADRTGKLAAPCCVQAASFITRPLASAQGDRVMCSFVLVAPCELCIICMYSYLNTYVCILILNTQKEPNATQLVSNRS